jgi:hypothetical protein
LYSTKRVEFQDRIFKTIQADFKARGLILEQLLIRNINLPAVKNLLKVKLMQNKMHKMTFVLQEAKKQNVKE